MSYIEIDKHTRIAEQEVELKAMAAQGAGGQNVNKVSSAIHLRFDIPASSLPEAYQQRLLTSGDKRISKDGVLVIKAQRFRTQQKNREDAIQRLIDLLQQAGKTRKKRVATRPSLSARRKRADQKTQRSNTKSLRGKVNVND